MIKAFVIHSEKQRETHNQPFPRGTWASFYVICLRVLYDTNEWPMEWMYFANKTQRFCLVSISLGVWNSTHSGKGKTSPTYNSVTSLGIPLGKTFKALLLHRTTVSKQVHSAGQRERGEQLCHHFLNCQKIHRKTSLWFWRCQKGFMPSV